MGKLRNENKKGWRGGRYLKESCPNSPVASPRLRNRRMATGGVSIGVSIALHKLGGYDGGESQRLQDKQRV